MTRGHLLVIDDSPTVLKVIELALAEAGHRVASVTDEDAAMTWVREEHTVPDLILLDGMLPGRDAAAACARFAGDQVLGQVPVVVMGARAQGDELEARLAKTRNVVDTIGKPFTPEALLAVVSRFVPSKQADDTPATGAGQPQSAAEGVVSETIRGAIEEALTRSAVGAASVLEEAREFAAAGLSLAGDLASFPAGDVLELCGARRASGIVRIVSTETNGRIELFLRDGKVDFAAAAGVAEEFLLGRFIAAEGTISASRLADVLAARQRRVGAALPPLGADLIARGLTSAEVVTRALARQTTELSFETLRWREGFFQLRRTRELPALAQQAALGLDVDQLLLEGYRRVDEWRVIEGEIGGFEDVFVRNDANITELPRGTLTRDELAVLEQIDGRKTVRDIIKKLRLGSFDLARMIFRLRRARLVRKRVPPVATT